MEMPETDREARDLIRVVRAPNWEMPAGLEKSLPLVLWQMVVDQEKKTGKDGTPKYRYSERTRVQAIRELAKMKEANDRRWVEALPQKPMLHVVAEASIEEVRAEMLRDDQFVEYLRNSQSDADPNAIRHPSEPGPLEAGGSPDAD